MWYINLYNYLKNKKNDSQMFITHNIENEILRVESKN